MEVTSNYKASSAIIASMLASRELGYQFTSIDLLEEVNTDPMQPQVVTLGSVSGFLNKASKAGAITIIGTEKKKGASGNPRIKYELIAPEKIKFSPTPGAGSRAGAQHGAHKMPYKEIEQKMNLAEKIEAVAAHAEPNQTIGEALEIAHERDVEEAKAQMPSVISPFTHAYGLTPEPVAEAFGRLHSALIDAMQPKPEKTLADFSTDELISELRSRLR